MRPEPEISPAKVYRWFGGRGDGAPTKEIFLLKEFFQKFWLKLLLQEILDRILLGHQMPCKMHGEFASRNEINAICELAMKINFQAICFL